MRRRSTPTVCILPCRIGAWFVARRNELEVSLESAAAALSVRISTLEQIERGEFGDLPEEIYRLHTLRTYAEYLGLSWDPIAREYMQWGQHQGVRLSPASAANRWIRLPWWGNPHAVRALCFGAVAAAAVLYLGGLGYAAMRSPGLVLFEPTEAAHVTVDSITVAGVARDAASVAINGTSVLRDRNGKFNELLHLQTGLNRITITATKKWSRPTIVERTIMVDPTVGVAAPHLGAGIEDVTTN